MFWVGWKMKSDVLVGWRIKSVVLGRMEDEE
jgi:hypothetical protein